MTADLPYPLPEGWTVHISAPRRRWPAWFWGAVAVACAVGMIVSLAAAELGWGILFAGLFGIIGAAVGVAYERVGSQRGLPRLINAVSLDAAEELPPDSWINFFREARASRWQTAWFAGAGWLATGGLVWAAVRAGVERHPGFPGILALTIVLGLGALLLATAGTIAIYHIVRHSSFGQRPIGISLGRHGVIRYYLDGVDIWPWESISGVSATAKVFDAAAGDFSATLVIESDNRPAEVSASEYIVDDLESHPWLVYTAVRFWAEHPELRTELSTTFAQRRIAAWRDAMFTAR